MPEALATTKRRFDKVLETLSNPPARLPEPLAKRSRRSASTVSSAAWNTPPKHDQASPLPNFSPWSHETFLARLQTFSNVSRWHPKPEPISEVQWAKRGWICVDVNTVACRGGCEKRVVVRLESSKKKKQKSSTAGDDDDEEEDEDERAEHERALADRYSSLIIQGHASECYWRQAGCQNDIYRLQVIRPSIWHGELRKRYMSLLSIGASIQKVICKGLPHKPPMTLPIEQLLRDLPKEVLTLTNTPLHPWSTKALEIALHGWRGSSDSGNDLLRCDACFQRIGLWMYQPGYKSSHRNTSPSVDDDQQSDEAPIVDLLEMHRDHCPWRSAESQKGTASFEGLNASQILQRIISTHAREHQRKEHERANEDQTPVADQDAHLAAETVSVSKEEIAQQDKERESRLKRLKSLFTLKKRASSKPRPQSTIF